jgi:hypothetical protein
MHDQHRNRTEGPGKRSPAGCLPVRAVLAALLLAATLAPSGLRAQNRPTKPPLSSNRWLLIVDTSHTMKRRSHAVLEVVEGLLLSGLNGELRRGDSLGVWTFNADLYTGRLPLQTWSPETKKDVASRTFEFLKAQKYRKRADFGKVLPSLAAVVKDSDVLTIILISSGEEELHGTPFDARINKLYQQWRDQQQRLAMPFITILSATHGKLTDFTVNTPPWPVRMPPLPQERQEAKAVPRKPPEAARKPPPATLPPLIISGRHPEPEPAPAPTPAPAVVKAKAPSPAEPAVSPGKPAATSAPEPAVPSAIVQPAESAAKPPQKAPTEVPAKPSAAPVAEVEPKALAASVPRAVPVEPPPAKPEATIKAPAPEASSIPAGGEASRSAASQPPPAAAAPSGTAVAKEASVAAPPQKPPLAPHSSPVVAAPVQNAAAVPGEAAAGRWFIWLAGFVLAAAVIGLAVVLRRRARPAPQGSLITRSIERGDKP